MTNSPLRPVDDQARQLAKTIVRTARFGALATSEPGSGVPFASRVGVAPDTRGAPVILISSLSAHFAALDANPVCSLLLGEPGKGDPLAHPRATVIGKARRLSEKSEIEMMKHRYLGRHPKAALYVDFADFQFWRLHVERAFLNAGFGSAYAMSAADIVTDLSNVGSSSNDVTGMVDRLNSERAQDIALCATWHLNQPEGAWRLAGADSEGLDLVLGDTVVRYWFDRPLTNWRQLVDLLPTR